MNARCPIEQPKSHILRGIKSHVAFTVRVQLCVIVCTHTIRDIVQVQCLVWKKDAVFAFCSSVNKFIISTCESVAEWTVQEDDYEMCQSGRTINTEVHLQAVKHIYQ